VIKRLVLSTQAQADLARWTVLLPFASWEPFIVSPPLAPATFTGSTAFIRPSSAYASAIGASAFTTTAIGLTSFASAIAARPIAEKHRFERTGRGRAGSDRARGAICIV